MVSIVLRMRATAIPVCLAVLGLGTALVIEARAESLQGRPSQGPEQSPYPPSPYAPSPYAPSPYAPGPYAPSPDAPNPYAAPSPYAPNPYDQSRDRQLTGTWYGDLAKVETVDGKTVNQRRWLRMLRPDGTYTIVFRYYLDNTFQVEQVEQGTWGQQGSIYWTQCSSGTVAGRPFPCNVRNEYDIQRIDAREMAYISRSTGAYYVMTRVPGDFQLP